MSYYTFAYLSLMNLYTDKHFGVTSSNYVSGSCGSTGHEATRERRKRRNIGALFYFLLIMLSLMAKEIVRLWA